jgi:hypothetical protein
LGINATGRPWKPNAVKIGFGEINVLTGTRLRTAFSKKLRDYLVCSSDMVVSGGYIAQGEYQQFLAPAATSHGRRHGTVTVSGPLRLCVFEPKPGLFPDEPDLEWSFFAPEKGGVRPGGYDCSSCRKQAAAEPPLIDEYSADIWDPASVKQVLIYLVDAESVYRLTGQAPAPSPITREVYERAGVPWRDEYCATRASA